MPKYYIRKDDFRIIELKDIEPYINAAKNDDIRYVLAMTWLSGARISEVISWTKRNIILDTENKEITISNKAKKHGGIGYPGFNFSDPYIKELLFFFSTKKDDERLFYYGKRYYQLQLQKLNKQLHGENTASYITFHQMRHSRITFLARTLRAFPEELKSWTGHRADSFEVYYAPRKVDRFRGNIR